MLTISLHDIKISATRGAYQQEQILENKFEVDVDIFVPVMNIEHPPFVDYTLIRQVVSNVFDTAHTYLEDIIEDIYKQLKARFSEAEKFKIVIRKLNPPMEGEVGYAQVAYEG